MIVFDIDGVILNFNKKFSSFCKEEFNVDVSANPEEWNFGGKNQKCFNEFFKQSKKTLTALELLDPKIPQCLELLKSKGIDFEFVTELPEEYKNKRFFNFIHVGLGEYRILHVTDKIGFIKANLRRYELLVDDKPKTIEGLIKTSISLVVPEWNYTKKLKKYEGQISFYDPHNFTDLTNRLLEAWGIQI